MIPDSVGAALHRSLKAHPEHPAIEFEGEVLTYRDLDEWSAAIAEQLRSAGIANTSRVALYTENCPEFIAFMVATARLGAAKVPLNPALPASTIHYALELSDTDAVLVGPGFEGTLATALEGLDREIAVIQFGDAPRLPGAFELPGASATPAGSIVQPDRIPADAAAGVQFTGGTTGRPKGVLLTQSAMMAYHVAQIAEAEIRRHERLLLMTPVAHAAGNIAETALIRGATILLQRGFSIPDAIRAIREDNATWTFLVPTMLYRLLDEWPEDDDGENSLETVVYGAAPISLPRLEQAIARFGGIFIQLYGQTECPNWGTRLAKPDHLLTRPERLTSCGQASLMAAVKIVDDAGTEVARGDMGEVCLWSPYLLREYVKNPEATAEKFLGDFIRTGDIGFMDEDGYVFLRDRKSDMIITGGMNVYSREVEAALIDHPDVASVAVVGLPHPDWGESVTAALILHENAEASDFKSWTRGKVASYAIPKRFVVVDEIPETPLGKVDKVALRALLETADA